MLRSFYCDGSRTSPVVSKMGLGWWQAFCRSDGPYIRLRILFHRGLTVTMLCEKGKAPGPSVVPAAKLYPMAGGQPRTCDHHVTVHIEVSKNVS